MHISSVWTLATLRRELSKTEDYIRARTSGMAGKRVGLTRAVKHAEALKKAISLKEPDQ